MGTRSPDEPVDALALRARMRTLRIGAWPSVLTACCLATYSLMTSERPHRLVLLALCALAVVSSLAVLRVPVESLLRGRWREAFFLGWSASIVVAIAAGSALDGGVRSPFALSFFLPLAYAALSYPIGSLLAVAAMNVVAFLAVAALTGDEPASYVLVFAGALVTETWVCAWQAKNLGHQQRELARVSRTDPLTGALNRRGFEERLAVELLDAGRHGKPLTLVLLDLDRFKDVNDAHGHAAGDELLTWVVRTLQQRLRARDSIGRLGGDEFALLLDQGREEAGATVERLVAVLAERTGVSAGRAHHPLDGVDAESLHFAADRALYASKRGVRGQAGAGAGRELSWAAALAGCVDERMSVQHAHSHTVAQLAGAVAQRLGWSAHDTGLLRLAATLHDVGKIHLPVALLRKPGPLDAAEQAEMAGHAAAGADIVARVEGLEGIAGWIRHAHERIDGGGYPDGLFGEAIPEASRILLVADAYDAMTSDRPYRRALPAAHALAELRAHGGTQFDPRCVAALEAHLEDHAAVAR